MTLTKPGIRFATAALIAAVVMAGCGGRPGSRGADAADTGASPNAGAVAATANPSAETDTQDPSAETETSAAPATSATPGTSAAPGATPKPTFKPIPVPTPDLDALDALIDQLDAALAADATATTDEGSPE